MPKSKKVFREGKIHVMSKMCDTCIFRPGNLMDLAEGKVEWMVKEATKNDSCIPCHKTTYGHDKRGEAVCRGFFELHPTMPLQVADRIGLIVFQGSEGESSALKTGTKSSLKL